MMVIGGVLIVCVALGVLYNAFGTGTTDGE